MDPRLRGDDESCMAHLWRLPRLHTKWYKNNRQTEGRTIPRDGSGTRTGILDAAEFLVLEQGFAATSVDTIIERAGITKGSFFYHFKSKADLAYALVERYAETDLAHLEEWLSTAERLVRDPLQQMLVFVAVLRERALNLPEPHRGCLFASYCYEAQLFDDRTKSVITEGLAAWRERVGAKFAAVMERYPPRLPATPAQLADMLTALLEGAFVLSRVRRDHAALADQLDQFHHYVELLFSPAELPPLPSAGGQERG